MLADIKFYLTLLLRRIHYVLILAALGGAVGVSFALILPSIYVADARLVVENEQIPGDLAASTVNVEASEQLELIRQRIFTRAALLDLAERFDLGGGAEDGAPRSPDAVVRDLRQRISLQVSGTNRRRRAAAQATLVDIRFRDEDPERAAAVVNELVTVVLREDAQLRTGTSGETLEFFEQEVDRLDQELAERGARIVAFQQANADALPEDLDFRRNQLSTAQERLLQVEREETLLRERRRNVEALRATGQPVAAAEGTTLSPQAAELERLRDTYTSSIAVLSPENPRMRVLRARIDSLEEVLAERERAVVALEQGTQEAAGLPLDPYELQLREIETQATFLADQRGRLEAQIDALEQSISATPANQVTLAALQRDLENVRRQYDRAVASRAQAETGDMIEALSKGQRVAVIEQATPPGTPVSPDRPRLVMTGFGGGLAAGLALVLLLELLNGSVRRPADIVRGLEMAPLGTLPFVRTAEEIRARRIKIAVALVLVVIGPLAALWAVDTYYMPLGELGERVASRLPGPIASGIEGITNRF
jgi:polysaccharide chain length determinant protein (PEP-CTERM system associated)